MRDEPDHEMKFRLGNHDSDTCVSSCMEVISEIEARRIRRDTRICTVKARFRQTPREVTEPTKGPRVRFSPEARHGRVPILFA